MTQGERGAGVIELVERRLANDLADVDAHNPRQQVPLAAAPAGQDGPGLSLIPVRESLLLTGTSGGGKSTLTSGLLERLTEHEFQFVVLDPEGDYDELEGAISIGSPELAPRPMTFCRFCDSFVGRGQFAGCRVRGPARLSCRVAARTAGAAGTHWPATLRGGGRGTPYAASHLGPRGDGAAERFEGLHVRHREARGLVTRTLDCVDRVIAVGDGALEALGVFARAHGIVEPSGSMQIERGQALTLSRADPVTRCWTVIPGTMERRRHARKYAEGKLGDDKAFYFRGPDATLNLRATNLVMFLEMADGVDEEHGSGIGHAATSRTG